VIAITLKRPEWPEVGDLVIVTVNRITDYGAYVTLDEYSKEGLLHVSEVASSWVRNIRDFVREGQKTVLKVLRVDTEKGHVDLSLRRVTKRERIDKVMYFKRERKGETLMRSAGEKLGLSLDDIYAKAGVLMEKEFGDVYEGLERAAREGPKVLVKVGVPEEIAVGLEEIAREKIRLPLVKIKGVLELSCRKPDGVRCVREALLAAKKAEEAKEGLVRVYVVAPPKYVIEAAAEDYKKADMVLQKASEEVLRVIEKAGGEGVFKREK
jgi:translation initiation factor 2 subunit 1